MILLESVKFQTEISVLRFTELQKDVIKNICPYVCCRMWLCEPKAVARELLNRICSYFRNGLYSIIKYFKPDIWNSFFYKINSSCPFQF